MSTRIVYVFLFAYFLLQFVKSYELKDLIHVGFLFLVLIDVENRLVLNCEAVHQMSEWHSDAESKNFDLRSF